MTFEPVRDRELCFLFSFHYFKDMDISRYVDSMAVRPSLFVDSGGFSAHTQGVSVSMTDYARWIRRHQRVIQHYANLDVIGDPVQTRINQRKMEAMGLRPLPVVHTGTDPSEIGRYADDGYRYICLGGMVPFARGVSSSIRRGESHPLLDWVDACFRVAVDRGVALHGFGATTWEFVKRYPWRSVDSSSWASGYRFGTVAVFERSTGDWVRVKMRDRSSILSNRSLIDSYGVNCVSLVLDDNLARQTIIELSAKSWVSAQRWLGRNLFLADSTPATADARVAARGCSMRAHNLIAARKVSS